MENNTTLIFTPTKNEKIIYFPFSFPSSIFHFHQFHPNQVQCKGNYILVQLCFYWTFPHNGPKIIVNEKIQHNPTKPKKKKLRFITLNYVSNYTLQLKLFKCPFYTLNYDIYSVQLFYPCNCEQPCFVCFFLDFFLRIRNHAQLIWLITYIPHEFLINCQIS